MNRFTPVARRGNVLVLATLCLVGMLAATALAVDYGYLLVVRTQLQSTADSAALAGAMELVDEDSLLGQWDMSDETLAARLKAQHYGALHTVNGSPVVIQANADNASDGDIVIGRLANPDNISEPLLLSGVSPPNTVRVTVRLNSERGNAVGLFFARVIGIASGNVSATASATLVCGIKGIRIPQNNANSKLLPFALWRDYWNDIVNGGQGQDNYTYDPETGQAIPGSDGIPELEMYPLNLFNDDDDDGAGEPAPSGNFGTVDVGNAGNSTDDLARQILYGVSPEDLALHGGELRFNGEGYLTLEGDTGISASCRKQLEDIIGQARTIPLYDTVSDPGNNAQFKIVGFVGIRVMEVRLTGALKHRKVVIQPANVVEPGGIPDTDGPSQFVYAPVMLTR